MLGLVYNDCVSGINNVFINPFQKCLKYKSRRRFRLYTVLCICDHGEDCWTLNNGLQNYILGRFAMYTITYKMCLIHRME